MNEPRTTRFRTAVEFTGRFLTIRIASVLRGDATGLVLKVTPHRGPDIDDWLYAEWDSKRKMPVPAGWGNAPNPWRACRYSGAPKGAAFASIDADAIVRDLYAEMIAAPTKLADLIEAHLDESIGVDGRSALRSFLDADLDVLSFTELLSEDGPDAPDSLNLAVAQDIQRTLTAGEQLSDRQKSQAAVLLEQAPWQFGYWGAVKALLKAGPLDGLTDAYADAVARLSRSGPPSDVSEATDIQNLDLLTHLFGKPRKKTRDYMARRVRRDLKALAARSPDTYAQVSARMLIAWDEPLSEGSYAPAYVLLGRVKALDDESRCVEVPADMASRRDPHPEIWDAHPELVRSIFASVSRSVETLTWAFQVMETVGDTPHLSATSVGMALESTYPPLRQRACAALPGHPDTFVSLATAQWVSFFQNASDADVARASDLLTIEPQPKAGDALGRILSRPGDVSDRRARLAVMYLAAPRVGVGQRAGADIAAVVAAVERFELEYRTLWAPLTARMTPQDLISVFNTLIEHRASDLALEAIADEVVKKTWLATQLAIKCIGSEDPRVADLGRRIVEANGGSSFIFGRALSYPQGPGGISAASALRIVSSVLPQATTVSDAVQLAEWALATDLENSDLATRLAESPLGRAALWELAATVDSPVGSALAGITPDVTRAVGESLVPEQLLTAQPAQLTFALRYISENPGRIDRDAPFGIAALESADSALQAEAFRQLATPEILPQVWLTLAESGVPGALDTAHEYTASLVDERAVRDAILACLRSRDDAVQDIGIRLFQAHDSLVGDREVWGMLTQSSDRYAQELVAEAALVTNRIDERTLPTFDARILTDRRPNRRAKELVKQRLERLDPTNGLVADQHVAALLAMVRTGAAHDREWALMRLADLALHGVTVDGLEFSLTTTGTVTPEDVSS